MKKIIVSAAAAAIVFGAFSLPVMAQDSHGSMHHDSTETLNDASKGYMDAMEKMDQEMRTMEMSNKPGIDFALMMIPHHQSAIDMAKAYLESDENDPELTKLSNDIIEAQEKEIAFLKSWLEKHGE